MEEIDLARYGERAEVSMPSQSTPLSSNLQCSPTWNLFKPPLFFSLMEVSLHKYEVVNH